MVKELTAQTIFIFAMILIVILIIAIMIQTAISNITFWLLRPSESAALDLVGYITALGGTTGDAIIEYKVYTSGVTYYVKKSEKIVCVIAQMTEVGGLPLLGGGLTTYNCYSTPFVSQISEPTSEKFSNFFLKKSFEDDEVKVEMS